MNQLLRPLVQTADFERVLKSPSRARSPHFVVHHLPVAAARAAGGPPVPGQRELSTDRAPISGEAVDIFDAIPTIRWVGTVVPKRHAKRAVTRNLVKRQMREAARRHVDRLPGGLWVLRLRAGFDLRQFPAAASDALRQAVRCELDVLLQRAAGRPA